MNKRKILITAAVSFSLIIGPLPGLAMGGAAAQAAASAEKPSPEAMDKLLAPIALYPDALVIQIVQCSASPDQVKKVNDWLKQNPDLKGTAVQDAAAKQGFEESFIAIVLFPQVLAMMADKPEWTQNLGQAFAKDRDGVLASVQRLRKQAQAQGNLKTNEQQEVKTITAQGQQVIVIQPANPQIVYVPVYNPQVVYVQPAPPPPPPSNDGKAGAAILGFAAGVIIGAAIADNNDDHNHYYSYGGWGYHGGACYPGGYNDFYEHREKMAKDYYEHRENTLKQRGENQSGRQDNRNQNQTGRQDSRDQNQTARQGSRDQNQAARPDNRTAAQPSAQPSVADRSGNASPKQAAGQSSEGGAFSGYQKGSNERASSARGNGSMSRSGGGGGGARGGGGKGR